MKFIDFFAGVGGFRRGLELAGHECVGFCEWDKYAVASYTSMHLITDKQREYLSTLTMRKRQKEILKNEYRNGEWYSNDIRNVDAGSLPAADCWCFGAPCQDFSAAGKRAGLDGDRSSLIREIFRLLEEQKEQDRPEWLIYENVKGMLSSNKGLDYLSILTEMDWLGYDIEWQNINSKWFVPQNRERIYTIGHKKSCGQRNIFPIMGSVKHGRIEKVFLLSERISKDERLFQTISEKWENMPDSQMQELLTRIRQEIQSGESREISEYKQEIRPFCEGGLQEIKTRCQNARSQSDNFTGEICGVVRIPTEEMLLLWYSRERHTESGNCIQYESDEIDNRSSRFIERVRRREFSTLLLAVQSYEEQLFYSIGDGRDWTKIYSKEMEGCTQKLKYILEETVPEKYFLSREQTEKINSVCQIASVPNKTRRNPNLGRTYSIEGISSCLSTMAGGNLEPQIALRCFCDMNYGAGIKLTDNARTLQSRYYKGISNHAGETSGVAIKIIGEVNSSQDGQVHDISGAAKCYSAGHNNSPKVAIPVLTPDRTEKRQNGRRFKENGEPMFTLTSQDRHGVDVEVLGGVYTNSSLEYDRGIMMNVSRTLKADSHPAGVALKIKEATKQGYSEAFEGDSINLSMPESKIRRGRIGHQIAQTLDTSCNQGTPIILTSDAPDLTDKNNGIYVETPEGFSVYAIWYEKEQCYIAIRRLTPKECFRLQGWTDDYFEKAAFVNSDSQLYKQAGNGVTVDVVYEIGRRIAETETRRGDTD